MYTAEQKEKGFSILAAYLASMRNAKNAEECNDYRNMLVGTSLAFASLGIITTDEMARLDEKSTGLYLAMRQAFNERTGQN